MPSALHDYHRKAAGVYESATLSHSGCLSLERVKGSWHTGGRMIMMMMMQRLNCLGATAYHASASVPRPCLRKPGAATPSSDPREMNRRAAASWASGGPLPLPATSLQPIQANQRAFVLNLLHTFFLRLVHTFNKDGMCVQQQHALDGVHVVNRTVF